MSCTISSLTVEKSAGDRSQALTTARDKTQTPLVRRSRPARRHSYEPVRRRNSSIVSAEAVFVRVDLFLSELEKRLDRLEKFRQEQLLQLDAKLRRGYNVLRDVRDSCSYSSGELLWGAAKQRAVILVETLEGRYHDAIPTRESLEAKAQASMRLMEGYLSELEAHARARQSSISAAFDEGWKTVDSTLAQTREYIDEGIDKALKAKEILADSISHALARAAETRVITYEDLPIPWRVNPHIVGGYRFTSSYKELVTSIFYPSNETVNIWSHLLGLLAVIGVAFYLYPSSSAFHLSTKWDVLIAACFFLAACKCLICSTVWHTLNGISDAVQLDRFACVDYTGISFLVATSILTTEWTAFYCEPLSRNIYMSLTLILGTLGTILPWNPTFNRVDMNWARVAFYVSLAATGFIPVFQLSLTRGAAWCYYFYAPIGKSVLVYLTGACIYAAKIPERWFPGRFDYAGCSHNIWHFAVLGGILFHYFAMVEFFNTAFIRVAEGACGF